MASCRTLVFCFNGAVKKEPGVLPSGLVPAGLPNWLAQPQSSGFLLYCICGKLKCDACAEREIYVLGLVICYPRFGHASGPQWVVNAEQLRVAMQRLGDSERTCSGRMFLAHCLRQFGQPLGASQLGHFLGHRQHCRLRTRVHCLLVKGRFLHRAGGNGEGDYTQLGLTVRICKHCLSFFEGDATPSLPDFPHVMLCHASPQPFMPPYAPAKEGNKRQVSHTSGAQVGETGAKRQSRMGKLRSPF